MDSLEINRDRQTFFLSSVQKQRQAFVVEIPLPPPGGDKASQARRFGLRAMRGDEFRVVRIAARWRRSPSWSSAAVDKYPTTPPSAVKHPMIRFRGIIEMC